MSAEIRFLADGETITGPGVYRCSMAHYHSQSICPGPSISSSDIRKIVLESPHAFWRTSALNPDRIPEKDPTDALVLGRAAHALILGDEVFDEVFAYVPPDAPKRPSETKYREKEAYGYWKAVDRKAGEWWEAFDAHSAGKMLLSETEIRKIQNMRDSLQKSPEALAGLTGGQTELSMIWQDEKTGLWIKSRPDQMPENAYDFTDLKTFAPRNPDPVIAAQKACSDHGYPMQMALAVEAAERTMGATAQSCLLVFIQTTEPHEVVPILLSEDTLYWAAVLNRHGIDQIAHGLETGEWPFKASGIVPYSYPPSMVERLSQLQVNGEIPNLER